MSRDVQSLAEEADVQTTKTTPLTRSARKQTCTQTAQIGGGSAGNPPCLASAQVSTERFYMLSRFLPAAGNVNSIAPAITPAEAAGPAWRLQSPGAEARTPRQLEDHLVQSR